MTLAELVIKLSADSATLKSDFDKAKRYASEAADAITSALGPIGTAFSLGAVGREFKDILTDAGNLGQEIYKMENITGLGAEALSGLRAVAVESGESFDSLSGQLARAGKNIEAGFINPAGETGKVLEALFGKAEFASLKLEPVQERIEAVTKKVFGLTDAQERDFAAAALFGRGWTENEETLRKLADEGFKGLEKHAEGLGVLLGEDDVQAMKKFHDIGEDAKLMLMGMGESIASTLIPNLNLMLDPLTKTETHLENIKKYGFDPIKNLGNLSPELAAPTPQEMKMAMPVWALQLDVQKVKSPLDALMHPPKMVKPDTSWMREVEEGLRTINEQDRLFNELVKELLPNQSALNKVEEQYYEVMAKVDEVTNPATRAILAQMAALKGASQIDKLFDQLPMKGSMFQGFGGNAQIPLPAITMLKQGDQATIQWGADAFKFGQTFTNAFTQMIIQGKGFTQILQSMIAYIAEAILKAYVFQTIFKSLGGMGGPLGTVGEFFGGMAAGKAVGGDVEPYTPYVVGEQGPELFVPSAAGSITPNSKMSGGATYNIDARGADAGVEHRIMRALPAAMAIAAANGMKMAVELGKRT
jgi:hypothetical protein